VRENLHIFRRATQKKAKCKGERAVCSWCRIIKSVEESYKDNKMFLQNISKRKILLLIINALISILMISCVIFLYYYLPSGARTSTFTVEKENSIHITRHEGGLASANVRISSSRRPQDRSSEEAVDDTIYIDNENYGDENYDNSGVGEKPSEPVTAPITIIERPVERSQPEDDDFYYENYDDESESDDEDIVSSGDGKIVVNIKKPMKSRTAPPEPVNYIENVYSVSSEIVSNLKSTQYSTDDVRQVKDDSSSSDDEWQEASAKGKRLSGNNKKLVERSRQLLLCESARTGELCRMLFKGTAG
jgi:hypothetical protein